LRGAFGYDSDFLFSLVPNFGLKFLGTFFDRYSDGGPNPTIRERFWGDISKSWSIYYAGYKYDIANLQQNHLADKLTHLIFTPSLM
jgi:hypothetical protein